MTVVWRRRTVPGMNDNTSNTPDNASRPGNRNTRPRDEHGRFLPRNKANGEPKTIVEIANEALNNMDDDEFEAIARHVEDPNHDITVGEFLNLADRMVGGAFIAPREHKPTKIGQHVDVKRKKTSSHTRRPKPQEGHVKSDGRSNRDHRRTMMYQIRTLPGNRGYGLYHSDGVEFDDPRRGSNDIVKHWLGENWYQSFDAGAARVFTTPDEARKFRREHFSVKVDDQSVKDRREERHDLNRQLRVMGASVRHPSHTTKNKTERKPRKVRDDLVKLYALISAGPTSE